MKIGIIGGLSYQSTIYYYTQINEQYFQFYGNYPRIVINSLDIKEFSSLVHSQDYTGLKDLMISSINDLAALGIDVLLISSNTPHFILEKIRPLLKVKVLSILDAVYRRVKKQDLTKLLLLGTKLTMEYGYYQDYFSSKGVSIVIPGESDREFINEKLFQELARGIFTEETRNRFLDIIRANSTPELQGVILGCTEIPLLLKESRFDLEFLDTGLIHCEVLMEDIKKIKESNDEKKK